MIEPSADQRAIVCLGTLCLAPVADPDGLRAALADQPARRTIELPGR